MGRKVFHLLSSLCCCAAITKVLLMSVSSDCLYFIFYKLQEIKFIQHSLALNYLYYMLNFTTCMVDNTERVVERGLYVRVWDNFHFLGNKLRDYELVFRIMVCKVGQTRSCTIIVAVVIVRCVFTISIALEVNSKCMSFKYGYRLGASLSLIYSRYADIVLMTSTKIIKVAHNLTWLFML